jgi:hypothetical protein
MSETWYAAFAFLALLSLLNAAILVGVLRQIGVLHQRIPALGPGRGGVGDGPRLGESIPAPELSLVAGPTTVRPLTASLNLVGYVHPDCNICHELPSFLKSYNRTKDPRLDLMPLLVTDAPQESSLAFAEETGVGPEIAMYRGDEVQTDLQAPGSPYVLALSERDDQNQMVVLAAGVVNTLEQLEELVASAVANSAKEIPAAPSASVVRSVLESPGGAGSLAALSEEESEPA